MKKTNVVIVAAAMLAACGGGTIGSSGRTGDAGAVDDASSPFFDEGCGCQRGETEACYPGVEQTLPGICHPAVGERG